MTGMLIMKEYSTIYSRLSPQSSPAHTVDPEREMTEIVATHWAPPIIRASLTLAPFLVFLYVAVILKVITRKIPVMIKANPRGTMLFELLMASAPSLSEYPPNTGSTINTRSAVEILIITIILR